MILDAEIGVILNEEQARTYQNEIRRIAQLRSGIDHLYRFVRRVEIQVGLRERFSHMFQPEAAELRDIPEEATLCAFEWYSGCIREHCELVAEVGAKAGPDATGWLSYAQNVCGEMPDLAGGCLGELRLTVGGRRLVICRASGERPWSLTLFHEAVALRYGLRLVGM